MTYKLHNADCLKALPLIADQSVHAVICDPPYGTTICKWDSVIPLDSMWSELHRVIKPGGAIVLTAAQPFTTTLAASNLSRLKYQWVWEKTKSAGFAQAPYRPLSIHEDVLVFSDGGTSKNASLPMTYNPQGLIDIEPVRCKGNPDRALRRSKGNEPVFYQTKTNYPKSVIKFPNEGNAKRLHPTQKPLDLMRYLVRTYTNPGEVVLDFTMGSGTTGVACLLEGRKFVGIEVDRDYFTKASARMLDIELEI